MSTPPIDAMAVRAEALRLLVSDIYGPDGCGICEEEGGEELWFSAYSRGAHERCWRKIEAADSALTEVIDELFKNEQDFGGHNGAHVEATRAIRKACGSETILSYMEKNGLEALTNLFTTIGVAAAKEYAAENL